MRATSTLRPQFKTSLAELDRCALNSRGAEHRERQPGDASGTATTQQASVSARAINAAGTAKLWISGSTIDIVLSDFS